MFTVRLLLFAVIFAGSSLSAQNVNITLVGTNKPSQASSGFGDVWGDGNIACMGSWTAYSTYGVGFFDISTPSTPQLLTVYNFSSNTGNQFEQGTIRSNILYTGSWGNGGNAGSGIHILSITNPSSPVLLARITKQTVGTVTNGFNDVHTLFLERNFLYEAAHDVGTTNIKVFDVSNPSAPVFLQDIFTTNTTKVHQMTVATKGTNTILYTSGWGGNDNGAPSSYGQTDIWDVSNVGTQPARWLGRVYSGYNSHSSWPTPDGNTLIVCRETPGGEVSFYDVSTPPNPSANSVSNPAPFLVISPATMGMEADIPHNPVVVSNLLFLSWYQNGLQIFDITDRTKPVHIGRYDTYAPTKSSSYQGNWGIYPKLGLNKLLVSDINNGFFILNASAVLTATNNYLPLLITSPASQTATQGLTATLSTTVTGSSLQYQWFFNGSKLTGATNSSIIFNPVQSSQSGSYSVISSNSLGAVTSAVASLSVVLQTNNVPNITSQPQNQSVYAGQSATFSVAATGANSLMYQWYFDGGAIVGATNNSFTVANVQGDDVGNYSVIVTNAYGSVISSNAALIIIDSPYISAVKSAAGGHSAIVTWNTTVPSDSQVQYDPSTAPSQQQLNAFSASTRFSMSSYTDPTLMTNHSILLSGLNPGTRYNFQVVSTADTNHYVSGVYSFTTAGGDLIADDADAQTTYTGSWTVGTFSTNYYSTSYRFANTTTGSASATATFRPNAPVSGKHDVYTWYTEGVNRGSNVPYFISYNGGSTTVSVNQQITGGQWVLVASALPFSAGTNGFIRIGNNASNSVVVADAVKLVYVDSQDFPTDGSIPTWWSNFYFGGAANGTADTDGDGYSNFQEYVLGTSPVVGGSQFHVQVLRSGNAANITFSPLLGDRTYTLMHSSDLSTGWQSTVSTIYADENGNGTISLITTNAVADFYRIAVQLGTNGASSGSTFSGSFTTSSLKAVSPYATDPVCGPNRAYVR